MAGVVNRLMFLPATLVFGDELAGGGVYFDMVNIAFDQELMMAWGVNMYSSSKSYSHATV